MNAIRCGKRTVVSGFGESPEANSKPCAVSIMPMPSSRIQFSPRRARGFSLIEMIAAFLIFAIAVGVQMQVLTTSLHTTRSSAEYTQAALWAQTRLDTVGIGERIKEGHSNGRFDDSYNWQLDVQKVDPSAVEPPPLVGTAIAGLSAEQQGAAAATPGNGGPALVSPLDIYQVDLTVTWGSRAKPHEARFSTLRVITPDENDASNGALAAPQTVQSGAGVKTGQ